MNKKGTCIYVTLDLLSSNERVINLNMDQHKTTSKDKSQKSARSEVE